MKGGKYKVHLRVLNSLDHGLPQSRRRVYIVGILKSQLQRRRFRWPQALPRRPASAFLEGASPTGAVSMPRTEKQIAKIKQALDRIERQGGDVADDWFIDYHASPRYGIAVTKDRAGCLTRTRAAAGGPFITSRARGMSLLEMCRFQGFADGTLRWKGMRPRAVKQALGNSWSVNVAGRVLLAACRAASLGGESLVDPWGDASLGR